MSDGLMCSPNDTSIPTSNDDRRGDRRCLEMMLRLVPAVRRLLKVEEREIIHGGSRKSMETGHIRPQGGHGDQTQSKAVRLIDGGALATARWRLQEIDAVRAELPADERMMVDILFWSPWRDQGQAQIGREFGYSVSTLYRLKARILDHFADRLEIGYDSISTWFGLDVEL